MTDPHQGRFDLVERLLAPDEEDLGQVGFQVDGALEFDGTGLLGDVFLDQQAPQTFNLRGRQMGRDSGRLTAGT